MSFYAGPTLEVFQEIRGVTVNVNFWFSNPEKAHPSVEPRRFTYVKIGSWALAVELWKNPPPLKKNKLSKHFDAQFRAHGEKKPLEGPDRD